MVSEETMMFKFGNDENKAATIIRNACQAMEEKIAKTGLERIEEIIGRPEGSPASNLMLEWLK